MIVRKTELIEINDSLLESVPLKKFSIFSGMALSSLSLIKHNKRVISEELYVRILTHLTNFVNYSKMESERGEIK